MQIVTNGRNIELTESLKDYVKQKMQRLENHYDFIQEIHVILEVEKNPRISENQLSEATVHVPGAVIRLEVASENMYASIDKLIDKIDRGLKKHKTKLLNRSGKSKHPESIRHDMVEPVLDGDDLDEDDEDADIEITLTTEEEEVPVKG